MSLYEIIIHYFVGMVNTVYANTTISINLKCHEDYQVEFGWVLRKENSSNILIS